MRLRGQTLIELLIAMTVISTGLFTAATLVFSNLQLSDRDADEVVAVNLAREGIEDARQVRDSNWLAGVPFDTGLAVGTDYTATSRWDGAPGTPTVQFDFTANAIGDASTVINQSTAATTLGFLQQTPGTATVWRRLLTFHPICDNAGVMTYLDDGVACPTNPDGSSQKVGIRVECHMRWQRKAQVFDRTIYEDIYDWR